MGRCLRHCPAQPPYIIPSDHVPVHYKESPTSFLVERISVPTPFPAGAPLPLADPALHSPRTCSHNTAGPRADELPKSSACARAVMCLPAHSPLSVADLPLHSRPEQNLSSGQVPLVYCDYQAVRRFPGQSLLPGAALQPVQPPYRHTTHVDMPCANGCCKHSVCAFTLTILLACPTLQLASSPHAQPTYSPPHILSCHVPVSIFALHSCLHTHSQRCNLLPLPCADQQLQQQVQALQLLTRMGQGQAGLSQAATSTPAPAAVPAPTLQQTPVEVRRRCLA